MNKSTLYAYKDISSLTNNLIWLLKASVFILVSATIFDFYELKYFNKIINDFTSHNIDVQTLVSIENAIISKQVYIFILQMALAIITGVVFLRWTYFSNSNSQSFGAIGMKFTPWSSIGWYFVPIINLFQPYRAMKEIWKTSKDPKNWGSLGTPSVLRLWWALWIISLLPRNLSFRIPLHLSGDTLTLVLTMTIICYLVLIPLALITIKIVSNISGMQREREISPAQ